MNLFMSDEKLDRLIHVANSMRQSGEEKSTTEVIWENVLNTMDNSLTKEEQVKYLRDVIIYLEYNRKFNDRVYKWLLIPIGIGLLGTFASLVFKYYGMTVVCASATSVLSIGVIGLKLMTKNPYKSTIEKYPELLNKIEEMDEASEYIELKRYSKRKK